MQTVKKETKIIQAEVCAIEMTVHKVINIHEVEMGEFGSMEEIPMYMRHLIEEGFARVETKEEIILL